MLSRASPAGATCKARNTPLQIVRFVAEGVFRYKFQKDRAGAGRWMRENMVEMGPAFIKMGQFLSTRVDILDKHVADELALLQDNIDPLDGAEIQALVEFETNGRIIVEPTPIACASIGQVHMGVVRDTGERVAVKVQKPCVAKQIQDDVATLQKIADAVGGERGHEINQMLTGYERFLSAEIDYRREVKNMRSFEKIFEGRDDVRVPRVFKALSTERVLVMEYVPSTKIIDIEALKSRAVNQPELADTIVRVFLEMIVEYGVVHCDPHPGNMGVDANGALVLYDFGNVVYLSSEFRSEINNMLFAIYQRDAEEFVNLLVRLGIVETKTDLEIVQLKGFFRTFFAYLDTLDFGDMRASMIQQGAGVRTTPQIHINQDFLSLFRVFSLLDGTCGKLDSEFSYYRVLGPFVEGIMGDLGFFQQRIARDFEKLQSYPAVIQKTDQTLVQMREQMQDLAGDVAIYRNIVAAVTCVVLLDDPSRLGAALLIAAIAGAAAGRR